MFARVVARSFHARASPMTASMVSKRTAKEFKWQHLVTPWTSPSFVTHMKELDAKLANMRTELAGAPKSVEPINWAEWEASIADKDAVRKIRAEFEALKFEAPKGLDLSEINATLDKAVERTSQNAVISEQELVGLRKQLQDAIKEKAEVHTWKYEDYLRRYPGAAEQLREEFMEGYQLPSDAEDRLNEADLSELRKLVKSGAALPAWDPELPTRVGNLDLNVELAKSRALEEKLFGDAPGYAEAVAERDAKVPVA